MRAVQKAGYEVNPLEDGTLDGFTVKRIPMSSLTARAVEAIEGVSSRDAQKAKNLFALGVLSWLYDRPTEVTEKWIRAKFVTARCWRPTWPRSGPAGASARRRS